MMKNNYLQLEQIQSTVSVKTLLGMSSHPSWNHSLHTEQQTMFPRCVVISISGYRQLQNTSTLISSRILFLLLDGFPPGNREILSCWKQLSKCDRNLASL